MSDHPRAHLVGWILLALAGLALAVALSVTASNLSTQSIGLSEEPLRAGDRLAPPSATRATTAAKKQPRRRPAQVKQQTAPARTVTAPAPTTPEPSSSSGRGSDDKGGDDHGGRNRSGDD